MQSKDSASEEKDNTITIAQSREKPPISPLSPASSKLVTATPAQAEEGSTVPLRSLQTLNALEPEISVRSVATTRSVQLPTLLVAPLAAYRRSFSEWLQVWWEGIRPAYLTLAILPVLSGSTLAWIQTIAPHTPFGHFRFLHFIAALGAVIMLQMGANLVNDYYDFIKGVDTGNPLGPGGLIQQGLMKPIPVLSLGLVLLLLGALLGSVVALFGNLYIFLFGVIGLLCAFFYSATSRSLSSIALGEVVCFCIYGPLITLGAYLVQTGDFANNATLVNVLLYSAPPGLLVTAVVHVNNMRDAESDFQAGKRTLASMMGLGLSRAFYLLLLLGAYAIITALAIPRGAPHLLLITWWTLPTMLVAITGVWRADMPGGLHNALRETLKLFTFFTLLLIAALIINGIIPVLVLPHIPSHLIPF